jgi:hypothetical protein
MQRLRLAITIAGVALGIGLAAGIAHAQTTADQSSPPGPSATATRAQQLAVAPASGHATHLTHAAHKSARKHEAKAQGTTAQDTKAQTAPANQQTAAPASGTSASSADAAQNPAAPALAPASWNAAAVPIAPAVATMPAADPIPSPNTLVVGGRTVEIAAPDEVNAIDLNADVNASNPPPGQIAATTNAPAQTAFAAKPADRTDGLLSWNDLPWNSLPPWAAQALATLGGALSAVFVAWFLIGGRPVRTYS